MVRPKKRVAEVKSSSDDVYGKVEELPEDRRRAYVTILEDFDKQVQARIDANEATLVAMQNQIRSHFKMALMQVPRKIRSLKFEEQIQGGSEPRLSDQLAAVTATINMSVGKKVAVVETKPPPSTAKKLGSAVKGSNSKKAGKKLSASSETSMILAPPTAVRQSSRKRIAKSYDLENKETPAIGRTRGKSVLKTPANNPFNPSGGMPFITPKFNTSTPLHRSVMRTAKPHETLVSLSGSPVYVAATAARGRGKKGSSGTNQPLMVPVPLDGGKTLMVPAEASNGEDCLVDLDDNAKERLMALRSQIDNMLQLKQDS